MLSLILVLQSVGATDIPVDFDLKRVRRSAPEGAIVVTGRRLDQRIERLPESEEPLLPRAEFGLAGKARIDFHGEGGQSANGAAPPRAMVRVKVPF